MVCAVESFSSCINRCRKEWYKQKEWYSRSTGFRVGVCSFGGRLV